MQDETPTGQGTDDEPVDFDHTVTAKVRWIGQPEPVMPKKWLLIWVVLGLAVVLTALGPVVLSRTLEPATTTIPVVTPDVTPDAQAALSTYGAWLAGDRTKTDEAKALEASITITQADDGSTRYSKRSDDGSCWVLVKNGTTVTGPERSTSSECNG
jgi:hypothetical protein